MRTSSRTRSGDSLLGQAQRRFAGIGFDDVVAPLFALLPQRPAHQALVVDDQDLLCRHACLAYYGRDEKRALMGVNGVLAP